MNTEGTTLPVIISEGGEEGNLLRQSSKPVSPIRHAWVDWSAD